MTSLSDYTHNERQPRNGHISGAVTRMSSDQSSYAPSVVLQMFVWLMYRCLNGTTVHRWMFGSSCDVQCESFGACCKQVVCRHRPNKLGSPVRLQVYASVNASVTSSLFVDAVRTISGVELELHSW